MISADDDISSMGSIWTALAVRHEYITAHLYDWALPPLVLVVMFQGPNTSTSTFTEKTDLVPVYQEVDLRGLRHWIHLCTCSAIRRLAPVTRNPAEHKVPSVICRPWWCWISSCTWLMRSLAIWCFPGMSRGCFSGNGMLAYFSLLPMLNRWSESRKGSRDRMWLLFGSGKFCSRYFQSVCLSLDRTYYILLCLLVQTHKPLRNLGCIGPFPTLDIEFKQHNGSYKFSPVRKTFESVWSKSIS